VDVGPHDYPVISLVVPVARADGRDVHDRDLSLKLEVIGTDQAQALPGPPQHVEQLEQAGGRTQMNI
jgi:hypothetical protein